MEDHRIAAKSTASSHLLPLRHPSRGTETLQRGLRAPRHEDHREPTENLFGSAWDFAPAMLWASSTDCLRSSFNYAWAEFMGKSIQANEDWMEAIHPEDRLLCLALCTEAHHNRVSYTVEYRLRHKNGGYHLISDRGAPRYDSYGAFTGYIGCCNDINAEKESELARLELTGRLISAQEAERSRIARELHDRIGNALALLKMKIHKADVGRSQDLGGVSQTNQELCKYTADIADQVRNISHQLHSAQLECLGLKVGVQSLCREVSENHSINLSCICSEVPGDLDSAIALCIYRLVQEALRNVVNHSLAKTSVVELGGRKRRLFVRVSDDGIGFDMNKVTNYAGLGLVSMRERVHLVGGRFLIRSRPGEGTTIEANVDL
jgi:PAS domain S-box-containing protein